ncbi:hypothetical protein NGM10_04240 [Halorussus salilacus]|uniref:DUF7344 domain-containing protein n=1 Tax=Halorussus salilacus TaxID=2953750 RepID=UPI0020A0EB0B|nr:hypothetical protein [Halorussus salilacus]USZ68951.1 hypothetical protein NGM10_04240 [Halorussus salilacus]
MDPTVGRPTSRGTVETNGDFKSRNGRERNPGLRERSTYDDAMVAGNDRPVVHERIGDSCDLLASAHRRCALYALREDGPATVDELAEVIVAAGIADDRDRAVASLAHTHLPKLDEYDVVNYDREGGVVALDDGVERLRPLLEATARLETESSQWSPEEVGNWSVT